MFSREVLRRRLRALLEGIGPDVINIHNLHGAIPVGWGLDLVEECAVTAPVVWTMHDMWSFTGRCAYNWDCELFRSGCDETCPTHDEYPVLPPAKIGPAWRRRKEMISELDNLVAVGPSRWLQREAVGGIWPAHRVRHIPYGLPLDRYRPMDAGRARLALGIETSRPVVLVCAADWDERRKGGRVLAEALNRLQPRSVCLLTLGMGRIEIENQEDFPLGFVDQERSRVLAYSAADFFVHPAQVDNLPNVVLEAIACGTPVVGLPIGGVPDMVVPGITGWLAVGAGAKDLAAAVSEALADRGKWGALRRSCRSYAEEHYDDRLQVERYVELFRKLMSQHEIQ